MLLGLLRVRHNHYYAASKACDRFSNDVCRIDAREGSGQNVNVT
jgi:hypothetical protein